MIPARAGSERLKFKNLRLLAGKPVIGYAIEAAKKSAVFDRIIVNSDHPVFGKIAERYNVEFYQRPEKLGRSETRSDDVIADFMGKYPADILVWVNPIAPLQPPEEIRGVVGYFIDGQYDSLITVKDEQVHCVMEGRPLNFDPHELFAKTQDLTPVQTFVYSLMMWRYESFLENYRRDGYALLSGKLGYHTVCRESSIILKYEDDLKMAETLLDSQYRTSDTLRYDSVLDDF
jgi:CMP-N-acetylneuraminic acid synthetase